MLLFQWKVLEPIRELSRLLTSSPSRLWPRSMFPSKPRGLTFGRPRTSNSYCDLGETHIQHDTHGYRTVHPLSNVHDVHYVLAFKIPLPKGQPTEYKSHIAVRFAKTVFHQRASRTITIQVVFESASWGGRRGPNCTVGAVQSEAPSQSQLPPIRRL